MTHLAHFYRESGPFRSDSFAVWRRTKLESIGPPVKRQLSDIRQLFKAWIGRKFGLLNFVQNFGWQILFDFRLKLKTFLSNILFRLSKVKQSKVRGRDLLWDKAHLAPIKLFFSLSYHSLSLSYITPLDISLFPSQPITDINKHRWYICLGRYH